MRFSRAFIFGAVTAAGLAVASWGLGQKRPTRDPSEIAIQDGKTIDFSSGRPIVKDSQQEKDAIAKAVKEIEAATKNITFEPAPAPKK